MKVKGLKWFGKTPSFRGQPNEGRALAKSSASKNRMIEKKTTNLGGGGGGYYVLFPLKEGGVFPKNLLSQPFCVGPPGESQLS